MKLRVTMEVEFSELPAEVRKELADGYNFRADDDDNSDLETVPRVSEMHPDEIVDVVSEFFSEMGEYDTQAEMWAGSSVFGYFSAISVNEVNILEK